MKNDALKMDFTKQVSNLIGLAGAYGVSLADIAGVVSLPIWVAIVSALAGVGLTVALALIRLGEARIKMAEAKRLEIENEKLEHENTITPSNIP